MEDKTAAGADSGTQNKPPDGIEANYIKDDFDSDIEKRLAKEQTEIYCVIIFVVILCMIVVVSAVCFK